MPRSYTVTSLLTAFLASICIAAFCFIVDPYKLYPEVPHLSPGTSIDLFNRLRLHTPHDVDRVRPSILITGNSRFAALPPHLLRKSDEIAYNASLPGATLRELHSMVEHAHAIHPLDLVFIGVDQQMFRQGASDHMPLDERNRYRKIAPSLPEKWHYWEQRLEDYWRSLLDFTESNGIPTVLLILPMQGMLMNTIEFAGTWAKYLNWQRELVTRVDARHSETEIYGLENRPKLVLEDIGTPQHLFRDGVHLTRKGGLEIFTCMASPCGSGFEPTLLDSQSINAYLEQVEALRKQYILEYPADIAKARRWLKLDRNGPH